MTHTLRHALMHTCMWIALLNQQVDASELEYPESIAPPAVQLPEAAQMTAVHVELVDQTLLWRWALKSKAQHPISVGFTLYSPMFSWAGQDSSYPDRSAENLRVEQDAKPVSVQRHVHAYLNGQNIGAALKRLRIDPMQIVQGEDAVWTDTPKLRQTFRGLIKAGAMLQIDGQLIPNWQVLVADHWRAQLLPGQVTTLSASYRTHPSYEPMALDSPEAKQMLHEHCSTLSEVRQVLATNKLSIDGDVVMQRFVIDPTGLSTQPWQPIQLSAQLDKAWAGLPAMMSVTCTEAAKPAYGFPSLTDVTVPPSHRPVSVLVLRPQ